MRGTPCLGKGDCTVAAAHVYTTTHACTHSSSQSSDVSELYDPNLSFFNEEGESAGGGGGGWLARRGRKGDVKRARKD